MHSTYIWREKDTFIQIFTSLSFAQDSTDRANHALICLWKLYRLMHISVFLYRSHSYKQYFHKLYLSIFGFVRVLEKIFWREKYLPNKQGHREIKVGISSKPLLKLSFHFYKHFKSRSSLLTDQCQISSVVLRAENSSDEDFLMPLSFKECIRLVLLPYTSRNLLHAAILLCFMKLHGVKFLWAFLLLSLRIVLVCFYKRHCSRTNRKLQ